MLMLGGAQIGMGWVTNAGHIWAVRFFLGVGEAGILGGLIVFMMHWYTVYQTAFRVVSSGERACEQASPRASHRVLEWGMAQLTSLPTVNSRPSLDWEHSSVA